jgi:hypothetical protein
MTKPHPIIFVDMDGVTADFDSHYEATVGPLPPRNGIERDVDWDKINAFDFYLTMPPMPDAHVLWEYLRALPNEKKMLTGVPSTGTERAKSNKVEWVKRCPFIPDDVETVVTRSKEKFHHCNPGDFLIDDWLKYRHLWENAGGVWITHVSADETIRQLKNHLTAKILAL